MVSFSFQSQRKAVPKNVQTTIQLCSLHMLARSCSKSFVRLPQYMNQELPEVQPGFRKDIGTRDQIASIRWITDKAMEFQKNVYYCFIDYTKALDWVDHNKLSKKRDGNTRPPYLSPEKSVCTSRSNS